MKLKRKTKKKAKISNRKPMETGAHEHPTHLIARVQEIAMPLCDGEGIELVHVEYVREPGGRKLRLYIDKPGGVKLDDCVLFSRELSVLLDINLADDAGAYNLEVSSPGFDRPLVKQADFERFKDSEVKIKTNSVIDGQKNFKGTLMGAAPGVVKLKVNGKVVQIPFQEIVRARLNPS